ncbi:MAG TPA: FHA domain-containing protein [candidate division Zixibacteria bacterium]|jgi:pSer/pThr/pTyr-binding forkhead associated (FHA) protein
MPRFEIAHQGRTVQEVSLDQERIELGSAKTSALYINDLLIALQQAAFVKDQPQGRYSLHPRTPVPPMTVNGETVSVPTPVDEGAIVSVEGYEIKVSYGGAAVGSLRAQEPEKPSARVHDEVPLPPPLEPDLPPPLDDTPPPPRRVTPAPAAPKSSQIAPAPTRDAERTVFIQKIGRLVAIGGPLQGQSWELVPGETAIGRDPSQNRVVVRLDEKGEVDTSVSRRHATVHVEGKSISVEDCGSAAGTFVNDTQVVPGRPIQLNHNDIIEIRSARKSTLLRVELFGAQQASGPAASPPKPAAPRPIREAVSLSLDEPPAQPRPPGPFDPFADPSALDPLGASVKLPAAKPQKQDAAPPGGLDENPFLPIDDKRGGGRRPPWMWAAIIVAIVFVVGFLFLWLM